MAVETTIQLRRDTAANWTSTNPTLAAGEVGYETDYKRWKIGDGSTAWASLAYRSPGHVGVCPTVWPTTAWTGNTAWTANDIVLMRPLSAGTVSKISWWQGASSGNVCVGIYKNASGGAGAPATRVATSGSVACPAGSATATVDLLTTVQVDPVEHYLAIQFDNSTASIGRIGATPGVASSALGTGLAYIDTTGTFPLTSTLTSPAAAWAIGWILLGHT